MEELLSKLSQVNPTTIEVIATIIFFLAIIHTFVVKKFQDLAHHCPKGSISYHAYHFLGEVEAVFGIWAGIFVIVYFFIGGHVEADVHGHTEKVREVLYYLEHKLNFTEPAFVFVIMCMAATRPVIKLAEKIIVMCSKVLPFGSKRSFYISALVIGPLLGSFITEPAAMTVTAIILLNCFYMDGSMSTKFKYATLGLLFVNISIGGTLTNYAAPPVVMVAAKWGWGMDFMFFNFGYKAIISIIICTLIISQLFKSELVGNIEGVGGDDGKPEPRLWKYIVHLIFLALVVLTAHHPVVFLGIFIFFLGFVTITATYQDKIKIIESLLVGFFLAGLVVLGGKQAWWLKPILSTLGDLPLFIGSTALTGITDNAALTYLASQVEGLTDSAKYSVMAGAVTGGGLTVIANAPNPAGLSILKDAFGEEGVSPLGLLKSALFPTIFTMFLMQLL